MSESSYYLSEQAADLVRSGAMSVIIWQSKGRACQGNSSCRWHLKGQGTEPQPLVCPHACLSVTSPPLPGGCPQPSSRLLSPAVIPSELPPFDEPGLLSEKSFQAGRVRTALWWGPRLLPALLTCRGGSLKNPGLTCIPIRPNTHTHTVTHASRVDGKMNRRGLGHSIENCLLSLRFFLSDGFNEGIWIFSSCAWNAFSVGLQKIEV